MDQGGTDAQTLKSIGMGVVSAVLGAVAGLQVAASDLLRTAGKLEEHGARMQALAARGVPFVGTGLIVASGSADVAMGKPVGQVVAETGAGLGGGVVGGMAGAAIGSAIFPGVGTVVGGVVGGVIGSITATEGVGRAMGDE